MFLYQMFPMLPVDYNIPPTIYSLLNSIVNYDAEEQTKIKDLAKKGREVFFDFKYPLTPNINKEDFEVMILNKFMMRRIGYETFTAFQLALNVKLNEIMPVYNKMFDALEGWDLFNSGEEITRNVKDNTTSNSNDNVTNDTNANDISDRRYSETPQDDLQNVKSGKYITDYNFDNNTTETHSNTNSIGTNNTMSDTTEIIKRTPIDKINIYKQFLENRTSIYTMIFKDLDSLFYQIV